MVYFYQDTGITTSTKAVLANQNKKFNIAFLTANMI
jgi:hypothetical protein